jgi:methionyl-tRNA formyltransferase
MSTPLRIAFFGTPELAVWVLEELQEAGIVPGVVVTAPDKPKGRKLLLTAPPVKVYAEEHGIPAIQPVSLKERGMVPELANSEWDLFIVAAYTIILPQWVLDLPHHGVLNVHPSLLPLMRGPSPVRSSIAQDRQDAVGVSVIKLDAEIDHGPVVAQARVELPEWPVRGTVLDELLFREGGRLLAEVVPLWVKNEIPPEEQDHAKATFTKKFAREDGELTPSDDAYTNYVKYCAMDGWPGTYFFTERNGERVRVKINSAEYENGAFVIRTVTPEGKKEMPYEVFLRS